MIMMKTFLCVALAVVAAAQPNPNVIPMDYSHEGAELQGYFSKPETFEGLLPVVIFIPDWDGVNLYEQQRATMVANELGWAGFAADIYGKDLHEVSNMTLRRGLATLYLGDPELLSNRIQAAVEFVRGMSDVDPDNVAIVGFCFGGTGVLQYALQGVNDVKAIVSVHGGLSAVPEPSVNVTPKILVLSGGEDDESTEIMDLEIKLDASNAPWEITRFSGIEHAFTVWSDNRYNEWADGRSWESMTHFLKECFDKITFESLRESINVSPVDYTDVDGTELRGYAAMPDSRFQGPYPAVVILPDWDGVNAYEQERATLLAKYGYVGFAADIFGAELQNDLDFETRINLTTLYRNEQPELFIQRIARAVNAVKELPEVDSENIALIGYCFGGTGILYYSMTDNTDVKVAVSFHGGLTNIPESIPDKIYPYVLILSGGADDAHGNQTTLELAFNEGAADWEITRWSGVGHGFTSWEGRAYNLNADIRSWEQMLTAIEKRMALPKTIESSEQPETPEDPGSATSNASPSLAPEDTSAGSELFVKWKFFTVIPIVMLVPFVFA